MKTYSFISVIFSCLLSVSCLFDRTEEFRGEFDNYVIEGLESSYTKEIGDTLRFPMTVDIGHIGDTADLEYYWTLTAMSGSNSKKDTVSRAKDLHFILSGKYGERISGQFIVYEKKNDLRYFKSFTINVHSPFKTGWCFLSEKENQGLLTFVSSTRENHVYDLYSMYSDQPMPRGKYVEFMPLRVGPAIGVVLQDKPEDSFFLDGKTLSYVCSLKERFQTLDYVNGDFKPENMCLEHTAAYNGIIYTSVSGKIYARSGNGDITYSYFGAPVGGDYKVGELYGLSGTNSELFVTYDYDNHRYIYVSSEDITMAYTYPTPVSDGYPFDISNIDVTPIWMGGHDPAYYRDNQFVAIVKDNVTQHYQLHQFHIKRQRVNGVYGYHLQDIKLYDFQENMEDCIFCTSNKVLYIARGRELYRLNLVNHGNLEPIPVELDGPITAMAYDSDTSLAIATDTGTGEMRGNVHFVSVASETLGEIVKTYPKVGGVIVDMVYKNQ